MNGERMIRMKGTGVRKIRGRIKGVGG